MVSPAKTGAVEPHVVPAQVRDGVLADVRDRQPGDDRERQRGHHERLAELGPRRVVGVVVDVVGVVGEQREPGVVGLGDRPAVGVAVDVADREVLEEPALPAGDRLVRSSAATSRAPEGCSADSSPGVDDPERRAPAGVEPAQRRRLAQDGPRMAVRRPVAHHAADHRRALLARDRRAVGLELGRLVLEGCGREGPPRRRAAPRTAGRDGRPTCRACRASRARTASSYTSRIRSRKRVPVRRRRRAPGRRPGSRASSRRSRGRRRRRRPRRSRRGPSRPADGRCRSPAARGRRCSRRGRRSARHRRGAARRAISGSWAAAQPDSTR